MLCDILLLPYLVPIKKVARDTLVVVDVGHGRVLQHPRAPLDDIVDEIVDGIVNRTLERIADVAAVPQCVLPRQVRQWRAQ